MITLKPLAHSTISQIHLVANTAPFLYKHYLAEPSLRAFADANSTEVLISAIKKIDGKQNQSLRTQALAYAALIALHYKPRREWESLLSYQTKHLKWLPAILALHQQRNLSTTPINVAVPAIQTASSSTNNIILTNQWDFPR